MQPPTATVDDAAQEHTVNSEVQSILVVDSLCREMQQPCGAEIGGQVVELQLRKFVSWMVSPDGGLRNHKSAKQHAAQIKANLTASQRTDIAALCDKSVLENFR